LHKVQLRKTNLFFSYSFLFLLQSYKFVTTQPLNMEFLPQIAQIYADLKPPKVVYWRKLIKKDFILICDVCVICGKYLFMNSLNRLSSYKFLLFYCLYYSYLMLFVIIHIRVRFFFSFLLSKLYIKNNLLQL